MSKKAILIATFTCVTMLAIVILAPLGIVDSTVGACISFGVGLAATGVVAYIIEKNTEKKEKKDKEHILFDKEQKTAKLLQRSSVSASFLHLQPIDKVSYQFKPSELVYTGATVGGVTTGGFHTTEAHYRERSEGASGKALLIAKLRSGETATIDTIVLTEKMVQSAANDPRIKKFLKGNELVLKYSGKETKLTKDERFLLEKATAERNEAMQYYVTQRAFLATQLTEEDCINIKRWVGGN